MFKEEMRYDYPLDQNSIVWDVGGYKGDFAHKIYDKYKCYVEVFEPIEQFYLEILDRFLWNNNITIYNYGLSNADRTDYISLNKDSSSTHRGERSIPVSIVNVKKEMEALNTEIDLMKINIEGEEYRLLEYMIDENLVEDVDYLQVQFHSFMPDAKKKRKLIQAGLSKTHGLMWNYDFIWESWQRK